MISKRIFIALILFAPAGAFVDTCPHQAADHILTSAPAGDFNRDGFTDGRDFQAYVNYAMPSLVWERARSHPDRQRVIERLESFFRWPVEKWRDSPGGMLRMADYGAQMHFLKGLWPKPEITLPILKRINREWPLSFSNHDLTLWQIPVMYRAASLSPIARAELEKPLRWCESRMIDTNPATAIYSTGVGSGLRDMVMIREILYGEDSAREVALRGFGIYPEQWGLIRFADEVIDDYGLLRVNVGAFGRWAASNRPALVWLCEVKGYGRYLTDAQRLKFRRFYNLPCTLLCVGGKTFTVPGANDEMAMNPNLGPSWSWVGDTEIDLWARWMARRYEWVRDGGPVFDSLLVPADPEGYTPPERPPGCSGDRDLGRVKLFEDKAGTVTRIEYLGDGVSLHGGHKVGRSVTIEVRK